MPAPLEHSRDSDCLRREKRVARARKCGATLTRKSDGGTTVGMNAKLDNQGDKSCLVPTYCTLRQTRIPFHEVLHGNRHDRRACLQAQPI